LNLIDKTFEEEEKMPVGDEAEMQSLQLALELQKREHAKERHRRYE